MTHDVAETSKMKHSLAEIVAALKWLQSDFEAPMVVVDALIHDGAILPQPRRD
jgi:hypothetical protein